jgi:opacity protein-like surface antigen
MRNNKMAFVLATAMGFGGMQVATAADMPVKAYPMTPPPIAYNWTGFYVGVDAGYHWNKVGIFNPATPASGTAEASPRSFTAGGHAGYLYQFNNPVVVGALPTRRRSRAFRLPAVPAPSTAGRLAVALLTRSRIT